MYNAYIVNFVGYSNNETNENNGFSYNFMLKTIPYHIKGGLNPNIQTALHENIGYTGTKIILHKHNHAETWAHLQEKPH